MKKSDFAIVTPSVTLNEIHFMGIPFIAIQTADNQKDMYNYIAREKKLVLKQFDKNELESMVYDRINQFY
jgi:spore coat polysaccharide biosynthesis predicted glycosyltransferase SpsG